MTSAPLTSGPAIRADVGCEHRRVHADIVAPLAAAVARQHLRAAVTTVADAVDGLHLDLELNIGPRRSGPPYKRVRARLGPLATVGTTHVLPLSWRPIGRLSGYYPSFEGKLGITTIDETSCLMSFVGHYLPPLGRLGDALDDALLSRLADATARVLVDRVAQALIASRRAASVEEARS